jgi:spore maturation protein CgeB
MCYPQSFQWEETGRFIHEAFRRLGWQVKVFDDVRMSQYPGMDAKLLKEVDDFKPDIFFMLKSERIMPSTLDAIKCKKVYWHPDVRKQVQDWVVTKALKCDAFFTMSKGSVAEYKAKGVSQTHYLPEACDPNYHFCTDEVSSYYKSPVNFIGTVRQERIPMLQKLAWANIPFKIWGEYSPELARYSEIISNHMRTPVWREYHSYPASNAISVTWDWCPEVELSYSARIYRVMASKGLYLCRYVEGMENVFTKGVHCDWFYTLDEMVEKIRYYLNNPEIMKRIGDAAQKEVYSKHTFDHRVKEILKVIE